MMLIKDQNKVKALCTTSVTFYSIEQDRFFDLVKNDEKCYKNLQGMIKTLQKVPAADRILDFIHIKRRIKLASGEYIEGPEAVRAS